jgi:hypothetical protein
MHTIRLDKQRQLFDLRHPKPLEAVNHIKLFGAEKSFIGEITSVLFGLRKDDTPFLRGVKFFILIVYLSPSNTPKSINRRRHESAPQRVSDPEGSLNTR